MPFPFPCLNLCLTLFTCVPLALAAAPLGHLWLGWVVPACRVHRLQAAEADNRRLREENTQLQAQVAELRAQNQQLQQRLKHPQAQ